MSMVMRHKWVVGFIMVKALEIVVLAFLLMPSARAADGEAAQVGGMDASRDQILQDIEVTRQSDPELAAEMEHQLGLLETGQIEVETPERAAEHLREAITQLEAGGKTEQAGKLTEVLDKLERGEITPEQCMVEAREVMGAEFERVEGGGTHGDYMPPEVRAQLEKLFEEKGTGDPSKDAHVREEAERIMREHGIEPPKWEHEGEWEHSKDEWGPVFDGSEVGDRANYEAMRETFEQHGASQSTHEAPEQHTYEAPTHEYEAPTYETQTHEYEYQSGDGSGMGPH